ncbi:hypothetical protein SprV_0401501100 [Sparganum proliferum]
MLRSKFSTPNQGIAFFACCMSDASTDQKSKINRLSISGPTDFRHLTHIGCADLQSNMTSSALAETFSSPASTSSMVHLKLIDLSEAIASHREQANRHRAANSSAPPNSAAIDRNGATTQHQSPSRPPPPPPPAKPPRRTPASDTAFSSNRRRQHRRSHFENTPLPPPPPPPPVLVGE